MKWTKEQEQVISLRDRNILVSAAAGSGKTAVLVARILAMVTDPVHPVNIDELLVVTFTKAAAAEMKERVRKALEDQLLVDPENEHLQRQSALIHHAQITTIDGFCGYVIQNYFHTIDLDPVYRIADEGEMKLLEADVVNEVLEDTYEEKSESFLNFTEQIAPGKSDKQLESLVLRLYHFALSDPYPSEWLKRCLKLYEPGNFEDFSEIPWVQLQLEQAHLELVAARLLTGQNQKLAEMSGGPHMYLEMLESDAALIEKLIHIDDYDSFVEALTQSKFQALSRKKDDSVDPALKEKVKKQRDEVKKIISELAQKRFPLSSREIMEQMCQCQEPVKELVELTTIFMQRIAEKKREKNLMDFSDLEHFALEILVEKQGDSYVRTDAARELSQHYREVMIDEYQDSNYIQEYLLKAVSRVEDGINNRFMVGDVKQSIYGFRMAKPQLFLEKQHAYSQEDAPEQRIDLHKNFRSRENILHTTNYLFRQLMMGGMGGIEYDESEALYPGADYPDSQDDSFLETEVLLIDKNSPEFEDQKSKAEMIETEAMAVAQHMRGVVGHKQVWDKDLGSMRLAKYRDCVILLRTVSEWADIFSRVLQSQGIPAYATSKTGYFSTVEVETVMNYLHICDNPLQEIPFTAVLHSPIGGFDAEELALIRSSFPEGKIYAACEAYEQAGADEKLQEKLRKFLAQLRDIRSRITYTTIHELLEEILEETGYGACAAVMPGGQQRQANLQMLVEKAIEFEKTSYRGLFNFIRYMEQIQKYEVDFGEVNIYGETADTVRLMSIHKSKGLEFPVVYVCGLGKQFNFMDSHASVLMHAELGIGMDLVDVNLRSKTPTQLKRAIASQMTQETLSEELRVLYVALTRAKEKLILTALGKADKWGDTCSHVMRDEKGHLTFSALAGAKSYMDWILPALVGHHCFDALEEYYQMENPKNTWCYQDPSRIKIHVLTPGNLALEEMDQRIGQTMQKEQLLAWDEETGGDKSLAGELEKRFSYEYPYEKLAAIPVKMTVSELKKAGEEEPGQELFFEPDIVPLIPKFMQEEDSVQHGAARGSVYHRMFECMDYQSISQVMKEGKHAVLQTLKEQADAMVRQGKIAERDVSAIRFQDFFDFLETPLGVRMQQAAYKKTLKREQPFVIQIPAVQANESWPEEETILVQGIIDAYFEEEGSLIIVDYKTDRVTDGTGRELVERYQKQLQYYRKALIQLTGKPVREMLIYSVTLGKILRCEP
ncbi:MAG: helicase-exonuclease AddAB subunit AddA [Lachnospiraceae bacterium]|nr:helicase-exonuclease AddAB subunit AddA [Lachnospiraceae bacterium]